MKKVLFAALLVAAMGSSEVKANSFAPESVKSEQKANFFYWCYSYQTVKKGNCTITYLYKTKYVFGCPVLSYCLGEVSRSCDTPNPDNPGGGDN